MPEAQGATGPRGRAPAKINLTLAVMGGPRADGYHALRGVFARLELADQLSVIAKGEATGSGADTVQVVVGSIASDHPNDLILRAAELVRGWAGRPLPALRIEVAKRIPIAAGLAGGSSDGAATLRLVADAWSLEIPPRELDAMALALGADAPFFLGSSPVALVGGRGETVEPLPAGITGAGILLIVAGGKPSTGDVFVAHDRWFAGSRDDPATVARATPSAASDSLAATDRLVEWLRAGLSADGLADLAERLRDANDLYPAAVRLMPHLDQVRKAVEKELDRPALLSGAGSTLFVVYPSAEAAMGAGRGLEAVLEALPGGRPAVISTAIASQ